MIRVTDQNFSKLGSVISDKKGHKSDLIEKIQFSNPFFLFYF